MEHRVFGNSMFYQNSMHVMHCILSTSLASVLDNLNCSARAKPFAAELHFFPRDIEEGE